MRGAPADYLKISLFVMVPIKKVTYDQKYSKQRKMKLRGSASANKQEMRPFAMVHTIHFSEYAA